MPYFARLDSDNNITFIERLEHTVITDENGVEQESIGIAFLQDLYDTTDNFALTFYDASQRKYYAQIGGKYDAVNQVFIPKQPWPSFTWNATTFMWDSPIPKPDDGGIYVWREVSQTWMKIGS